MTAADVPTDRASPPANGSPPFAEDALLPLSALRHLLFCERQCALIHVEGLWAENRLTVEGRHLHERADSGRSESRPGVRIARTLPIRSLRLGLIGRADVVEFHDAGPGAPPRVVPVEYKRGRPKLDESDRVQLCAQALCLEEMLGVRVHLHRVHELRRGALEERGDALELLLVVVIVAVAVSALLTYLDWRTARRGIDQNR